MKILRMIKESRIERTFPSIMMILFSLAIIGRFDKDIIFLTLSMVLIYSSAGIHNSIKDKNLMISDRYRYIYIIPIMIALIISIQNIILIIASLLWIILGLSYNTISRKILLADSIILSITHYAIPTIFSLLLLGESIQGSLRFGTIFFLTFMFVTPVKNLKETDEDKKLDYRTLPTIFKNGKELTIISSLFFMIISIIIQASFNVNIILIIISFILYISGIKLIIDSYEKKSLKIFRLLFIFFIFSLITTTENNTIIILSSIFPIFFSIRALR